MNTRDQFGNYLLLKKLTEDVLGETFRAGRLGKQGVERVTLLRVFNGQGLDGERLAQRIQQRAPLQAALKSPNLAQGIDLGQVRGVPYVAYDYVSGKSLAQLLEQSARKHSPIPLDHALLMAERIALGLVRVGLYRWLRVRLRLASHDGRRDGRHERGWRRRNAARCRWRRRNRRRGSARGGRGRSHRGRSGCATLRRARTLGWRRCASVFGRPAHR